MIFIIRHCGISILRRMRKVLATMLVELSRKWHTAQVLLMISNDRISLPSELYEWVPKKSSLINISVVYKELRDYVKANTFLEHHFEKCKTILGPHALYCSEAEKNFKSRVKTYSFSDNFHLESFVKPELKRTSIYSKTSFIGTPLKCKHLVYRDLEVSSTTTYSLMVGCHDYCCYPTSCDCTRSGGWRRNKMSR